MIHTRCIAPINKPLLLVQVPIICVLRIRPGSLTAQSISWTISMADDYENGKPEVRGTMWLGRGGIRSRRVTCCWEYRIGDKIANKVLAND